MRLVVKPNIADALAALPEAEAAEIIAAINSIPVGFGRPHEHSGLGIRQLRPGVYEARVGLRLRAVFTRERDALFVRLVGTHDDVRRFLRRT